MCGHLHLILCGDAERAPLYMADTIVVTILLHIHVYHHCLLAFSLTVRSLSLILVSFLELSHSSALYKDTTGAGFPKPVNHVSWTHVCMFTHLTNVVNVLNGTTTFLMDYILYSKTLEWRCFLPKQSSFPSKKARLPQCILYLGGIPPQCINCCCFSSLCLQDN